MRFSRLLTLYSFSRHLPAHVRREILRRDGNVHEYQYAGGLVFDEIKIQEGLVWNEGTGRLVGFADPTLLTAAAQVSDAHIQTPCWGGAAHVNVSTNDVGHRRGRTAQPSSAGTGWPALGYACASILLAGRGRRIQVPGRLLFDQDCDGDGAERVRSGRPDATG